MDQIRTWNSVLAKKSKKQLSVKTIYGETKMDFLEKLWKDLMTVDLVNRCLLLMRAPA